MRNLNSILLEGSVASNPSPDRSGYVTFQLAVKAHHQIGDKVQDITEYFPIAVADPALCRKTLLMSQGTAIRLVGRLINLHDIEPPNLPFHPSVAVCAEHIELLHGLGDSRP